MTVSCTAGDYRFCAKTECPAGYTDTSIDLTNEMEKKYEHVASAALCSQYCTSDKTGTCLAFEYQSAGHVCKLKHSFDAEAGNQLRGWVSCVSTTKQVPGAILVKSATVRPPASNLDYASFLVL